MHPFTHTNCNSSSNVSTPTNGIPTSLPWPPFQLQHRMWITCLTKAKPPDTVMSPIFGDATFGPPALIIAWVHVPWEQTNRSACNSSECYYTFLKDVMTFRMAKNIYMGCFATVISSFWNRACDMNIRNWGNSGLCYLADILSTFKVRIQIWKK